jgi:hypothetical protein
MISKEALKEFKHLYRKRFRVKLSDEETYRRASRLLDLYGVVYGRNRENDHKVKANKS